MKHDIITSIDLAKIHVASCYKQLPKHQQSSIFNWMLIAQRSKRKLIDNYKGEHVKKTSFFSMPKPIVKLIADLILPQYYNITLKLMLLGNKLGEKTIEDALNNQAIKEKLISL